MTASKKDDIDLDSVELAPHVTGETFDGGWFADRRSGSLPPPRTSQVPPIGDDEVDRWLR
jgi:hypothetical protein